MEENMELRHMPEIASIAEYLRSMTFKRRLLGGCDPENVYDHLSVVSLQYEAIISACLAQIGQQARYAAGLEAELAYQRQLAAWYGQAQTWQNTYYG